MTKVPSKKRACFFVFLVFMLCNMCSHIEPKSFMFEAELVPERRFLIRDVFHPEEIHIHNDNLILCQVNLAHYFPDIFFQAYSLPDNAYKGSFGRKGRGPGEWLNPRIIHSSVNAPHLYLWDGASSQKIAFIYKMLLDSMLNLIAMDTIPVDKGYCFMNCPSIKSDSLLMFEEVWPEPAIRIHHLHQEYPVTSWDWSSGSSLENRLLDKNIGTSLANDSRIVYLYNLQDRVDFMDWNLRLKKRLNFQKTKPVIHEDTRDNIKYYGNSYLGEHFLYASYSGMSSRERGIKKSTKRILEVFDLNGTPIYRYIFPEFAPVIFTVDERTFSLYGYRGTNGLEDSISVYHLSGLREYLQEKTVIP